MMSPQCPRMKGNAQGLSRGLTTAAKEGGGSIVKVGSREGEWAERVEEGSPREGGLTAEERGSLTGVSTGRRTGAKGSTGQTAQSREASRALLGRRGRTLPKTLPQEMTLMI